MSKNMAQNSLEMTADTHPEYFIKLLDAEIEYRSELRKERNIKNAGFYSMKSFPSFRSDDVVLPAETDSEYLRQCRFIDNSMNLVFYGNIGAGKTHLATAIGIEACNQGKTAKFYRTAGLVNSLAEAKKNSRLTAFLKSIQKCDLLILDEWGYVPFDRDGARLLFDIISECYEKKSVIITTNIEFSRWSHVLFDEQLTAALLDRLLHHCHLLIFNGDSERLKTSNLKHS
ncbi:MAG: IS21-like element helper ATPase IstB [Parabacteroides sp.]|nr:IS21-like element helper ATPase IstB [Parabacteroides sp.]